MCVAPEIDAAFFSAGTLVVKCRFPIGDWRAMRVSNVDTWAVAAFVAASACLPGTHYKHARSLAP